MRCDLHVHTVHSGMCTVPGFSRFCLESWTQPDALNEVLRRRGMDLITVTDHDSIDAAEELRKYPGFFLSEEVSCTMPSGTAMHAGVYGMEERDHTELQRRRDDVERLLAYTRERRLFVTVNHLYSSLTGKRTEDDFAIFAREFDGIESRNGQMLECANRMAAEFAGRFRKPVIGGSDAHTVASAGRTWTEVPGARNAEEFLAGLRLGRAVAHGESGNYFKLTGAVCSIGVSLAKSHAVAALCSPVIALAPAVTLANYFRELAFAWYWAQRNRPEEPTTLPEVAA